MNPARHRAPSARLVVLLAIAAAAGSPAGCANVQNARWTQNPSSAVPGERTPTAAELGLATDGSVALDLLVATALRVHPGVVGARRRMEAACARVREAEAAYRPRVSMDGGLSYERSKGDSQGHRFESLGFDVSWLLFDFGQAAAFTRQAGEEWLAAQEDVRTAELDVAFGVRSAYFRLEEKRDLLRVAEATVAQFQKHLQQVTKLVDVGSRIPYDQTKAEVDLGQAQVLEVAARNAVATGRATLASAVGLAEIVGWSPVAGTQGPAVPSDFEAAWRGARPQIPSVAAAAAREAGASALVDARIAALYPSLSLEAGYARAGATVVPWSLHIGPAVHWTPFDGFENLATIDESVASLGAARATQAQTEQAAWLDARTQFIAIEDATQRLALAKKTVVSAEESLRLAERLFEAGSNTSVELADATQSLALAHAGVVTARSDLAVAQAGLARALGIPAARPQGP